MEFKDYYATLGVDRRAPADEVKAAFRALARKHHPDVNPGDRAAEQRFKEINEAYEVLGDPETRRKYDTLGADWKHYEQARSAGGNPFAGRNPFAGGWSFAGRNPFAAGGRPPGGEDFADPLRSASFSDFFQTFFGGAAPGTGPGGGPQGGAGGRGGDVERPVDLTLEEAFTGATRRLVLASGERRRTVDVRIPAGIADGARVRVAGRGAPGPAGAGDLLLRVRMAAHPVFTRKGRDLSMQASIPLTTAVLGGDVRLAAIDGGTVRLKVPPGTQPGQVFRIRGRGMPSPDGARGDLYATAHVELPRKLSADARRHFEALAALADRAGSEPDAPTSNADRRAE